MKLFMGILIGIVLMGIFTMKQWQPTTQSLEPPSPFAFDGDKVIIASWSKFLKHLEITTVAATETQKAVDYHTVGQIIALSNTSNNLGQDQIAWVELDPELTKSVGLDLANNKINAVGVAYGLTRLPIEYAGIIQAGQEIEIARYGVKDVNAQVKIVKIIPKKEEGKVDVVFQFSGAQDWFPGTNCDVIFPFERNSPVRIPTTAFIHKGMEEFVWIEVAPHQFEPRSITVVDSTPDTAWVLGLHPGNRIISRGGILLKPFLHQE